MTDLAKLVVRLEAQTAQFSAQLDAANRKLNGFEGNVRGLLGKVAGAFAGFQLLSFGKQVIDAGDRLNDMSKIMGESVENLSRLEYAANQSGSNLDSLSVGLKKLVRNASEAAAGSKEQKEAFDLIGVSATDAGGKVKPLNSLFLEVAEKLSKYENGAQKAAVAQRIFGKAGADLIPLLNEGASGIAALEAQADKLGITMTGEFAQGADDFNDALNTMEANAKGAAREILVGLLPALTALAKGLNAVSSGAVFVFQTVGKDIGALSAAAVKALSGDLAEAKNILKMRDEDFEAEMNRFVNKVETIWAGVETPAKAVAEELDTIPTKVKKVTDALSEVTTSASKSYVSPMQSFYDELDAMTKTSTEKQLEDLAKIESALWELQDAHKITAEQAAARWSEALDTGLTEVQVTAKKVGPDIMKEFNKLSEFELQLARNTQDLIADNIISAFDRGAKGVLQSFGKMIQQLLAQALAADLGRRLFGDIGSGSSPGGGLGGWAGKALGFASKLFGGPRDSGGRGQPGHAYMIGTGAQPEMFVPDSPGTFIPANMQGGKTEINFHVSAPDGRISRETQQQMATRTLQALSRAGRRNG